MRFLISSVIICAATTGLLSPTVDASNDDNNDEDKYWSAFLNEAAGRTPTVSPRKTKKTTKSSKKDSRTSEVEPPHPNPGALNLIFPSDRAEASTFQGKYFIPQSIASLYPPLGGPHHAKESFENGCKHGVDRVDVAIEIDTQLLSQGSKVGFMLSVNGIYVADSIVGNDAAMLTMEDVIYPPISDPKLDVKLEVAHFSGGKLSSSNPDPSGVLPKPGGTRELILTCADPFTFKGSQYGSNSIQPGKKKLTVGSLTRADFEHCHCKGLAQVLPSHLRMEIFPKEKRYGACNDNKPVLFPVLEEPFNEISLMHRDLFFLSDNKLIIDSEDYYHPSLLVTNKSHKTSKSKKEGINILRVYDEVCGGMGLNGTVRMAGCECEEVPNGVAGHEDLTFDFDVNCPTVEALLEANKRSKRSASKDVY